MATGKTSFSISFGVDFGLGQSRTYTSTVYCNPHIQFHAKRVIYHDPATIVYWEDGTKTVVKAHDEPFDKEKGLAMAILKKALGGSFHRFLRDNCK